jgi:hypothetical protein
MGGDNYYWNVTPLITLYVKHEEDGKEDSVAEAGKHGGRLIKKEIFNDQRKFRADTFELIRKYKLISGE